MQSPLMLVFVAVLFFILTPGVLVRLPPKCTLLTCAAFHAVVFTLVYYFGTKFLWNLLKNEGMEDKENFEEGIAPQKKNQKTANQRGKK